jgi:hypothetical protein
MKALLVAVIVLTFGVGIAACGGSSQPSAQGGSSPSTAASPPAASGTFAANLTFTGSLAGAATQAKAPAAFHASDCGGGSIAVAVTLNGHEYDLQVLNTSYTSPKQYTLGDMSTGTALLVSNAQYGGQTAFTSKSGTVTYQSEKSITIEGDLIGANAATAHVTGSASCP